MFERIKAYRGLKKSEKWLREIKRMAEFTGDEALLNKSNEVLYLNAVVKREIWKNREMAIDYNLVLSRYGFI